MRQASSSFLGIRSPKRWWRNLRTRAPVELLHRGRWLPAEGVVLGPGAEMYDDVITAHRRR